MRMGKEVKWNLVFCLLCSPYKKGGAGALPEPLEAEEAISQVPLFGTRSDLTHLPAPPSEGVRIHLDPMLSPAVSPALTPCLGSEASQVTTFIAT